MTARAEPENLTGRFAVHAMSRADDWETPHAEQATERRFLRGRLRFSRNGVPLGTKGASCPFPSAIVVFSARSREEQR